MMDFVPENVDGGVVLNAVNTCMSGSSECKQCPELAIGVHNWLVATELRYLVVDFQDENDVCPTILTELLQLRKRLRFPFLFAGVLAKPKAVLESYAYSGYPYFVTPEDAVAHLKKLHQPLIDAADLSLVQFGEAIPCSRSRQNRAEDASGEDSVEAED